MDERRNSPTGERNYDGCTAQPPNHTARRKGTARQVTPIRQGSGDGQSPPEKGQRRKTQQPATRRDAALGATCGRSLLAFRRPTAASQASPAQSPRQRVSRRDDLLSAFPYRSTFRRRSLSSASLDEERHRNDKGSVETGSAPWARWLKWTGRAWLFRCNILARQPTPRRNALEELSHSSKGELEQARVGGAEGPASRCWPAWRLISRISAGRGGIVPSFGSLQFSSVAQPLPDCFWPCYDTFRAP
jgi:hypothetical protein